jgi:hypothetical protein
VDVDSFTPDLSVNFTFTTAELEDGTHTIEARGKDAANNWSGIVSDTLTVDVTPPPAPSLLEPVDNAATTDNRPTFSWSAVTDPSGVTYTLQVDNDPGFTSPEISVSGLTDNAYTSVGLPLEEYSWRVRAVDGAGNESGWSDVRTLYIVPPFPWWIVILVVGIATAVMIITIIVLLRRRSS